MIKIIANIEFNKIPLSKGIMMISESVRVDFPFMQVQAQLNVLVEVAKEEVSLQADNETKINQLVDLFYR